MRKKQEKPWQYKFSFALTLVMLILVLGYFVQSFIEIRKVQPVSVALERVIEIRGGGVPLGTADAPVVKRDNDNTTNE